LLTRYREERQPGERFGDFCLRAILEAKANAIGV